MSGTLYLIPNTLGEGDADALAQVLPAPVRARAAALQLLHRRKREDDARVPEESGHRAADSGHRDPRTERQHAGPAKSTNCSRRSLAGTDAGLVSEAGCPAVADPGALLVRRAHERGVKVVPLVGPSSILLALMASGLNGQSFAFNGYLPVDAAERRKAAARSRTCNRARPSRRRFSSRRRTATGRCSTHCIATCAPSTLRLRRRRPDAADGNHPSRAPVADWKKKPAPDSAQAPRDFPATGGVS